MTGIHARISAEVAEEERREGKKSITPYWRVIRNNGQLNDKYPGGIRGQAAKLKAEGHSIMKGRVEDFEKKLTKL